MKTGIRLIVSAVICLAANAYILCTMGVPGYVAGMAATACLLVMIFPSVHNRKLTTSRLRICADGCELLRLFLISTGLSAIFLIAVAVYVPPDSAWTWVIGLLNVIAVEAVVFWNGILRVYATSVQLGIKWRVIGVLCGWVPIAHLIALHQILKVASAEVTFEDHKNRLNLQRANEYLCRTKYPLLLVHGVFFRDSRYLNYWGRVPDELKKNGAVIHYGNHHSAASVGACGAELTERIKQIVKETGCEKVNIIAHSKGGLDCRYAISLQGAEPYVASLTTINTPHRGCLFADTLLHKIPEKTKALVANGYNATLKKFGESNPDFLLAVEGLTASACQKMNETVPDAAGVFYQSVGSRLNHADGGKFPLNFSYHLVKHFDGPNDGLVSASSCEWGEVNTFLTVKGRRGISHGDMIDLNRENIPGFDVREFYVKLVSNLRERGF